MLTARARLHARPIIEPKTADEQEALDEMSKLIEDAFNGAQDKFPDEDWKQLLGLQPASPTRRLILLARVKVDAEVKAAIAKKWSYAAIREVRRLFRRHAV